MKLFAQHGASEGEKITEAINRGVIDGVIYSPRDVALPNLTAKLKALASTSRKLSRLFDPQYYAIFLTSNSDARTGYLLEDYAEYLQPRRRGQLEREKQVQEDLKAALKFQVDLDFSGIIAPNILIPRSFDSVEAVISKNFIRQTAAQFSKFKDKRPVYATLAIARDALNDKQELIEFLNEVTLLDEPPSGFYVLIAARSSEARSDIYNADIIAAWMLINHTLKLNGFDVINGYSDILTPFLGAAGGGAGGLGWWTNLRSFSLDRFAPSPSGGRLPIQRYLSTRLMNRITYYELDALRKLVPKVLNGLTSDSLYDAAKGSEPPRNIEVIQSWEAVGDLNSSLVSGEQLQDLKKCRSAVEEAVETYENIPIQLDTKSNKDHLLPLLEGMTLFEKLAEIQSSSE